MNVISLCDKTGNMVTPWADAGYNCLCLDWQHSIRKDRVDGNITYRWSDIRQITPANLPEPSIIFAFPDCTHLSLSGARDHRKKGIQLLIDALTLVEACRRLCEWYKCPWMIENPMSRLSTCWRKPYYKFTHWNYGDLNEKQTWLWTGGGFVMPEFKYIKKPDGVTLGTNWMSPGGDRANLRSQTPPGFARAVFEANAEAVKYDLA